MGAELELGTQRKKRIATTYGKATRKRQPKAAFTPAAVSGSVSEEDPIAASDVTSVRRQSALVDSPKPSLPEHKSHDGNRDAQTKPAPLQSLTSSDRKRKASQLYQPMERPHPTTDESEEESPPSVPEPRRSRINKPETRPATKSNDREGRNNQLHRPSGSVVVQTTGSRLSSPPPTPTALGKFKSAASQPSKRKTTNLPAEKRIQKQPSRRPDQIPLHLARDVVKNPKHSDAPAARVAMKQSQPILVDQSPRSSPAKKPRKRLIDVLGEQGPSDAPALDEDISDTQVSSGQNMLSQSNLASESDQGLPETPKSKNRTAPAIGVRTFARSNSALKFTYGQGRKVLEEENDLLESLALPAESSYSRRRLDLGGPKKLTSATGAFDFDEDDGTTTNSPSSKLRGIHELRQAGANSRAADEMQDLVDQIGRPGVGSLSSRRAALLQVPEKMQKMAFVQQFLDHGTESVMLKDIGKESDPICGYLIMASLLTILVRSRSVHIGQLLRTESAGPAFARLLSIGEDIKKMAKDRKTNLSKRSQNSIAGVESLLRDLPVWDGDRPSFISPRSLAIKCLQHLGAQDILIIRDPTIFTADVTSNLFNVLSDAADNSDYWDYPKTPQSIELCGALSVLDAHAVGMATIQGCSEWAIPHLSTIADALHTSLQTSAQDNKPLEDLILKLTINVTNNNLAAPDAFASKGSLLAILAASICGDFDHALTLISQGDWDKRVVDSLVLRLGILINFAEHSKLVRQIVNDSQHKGQEPAKELIRLFNENHRRTSEADSLEKSHLNVTFGYLSVLLGYLALHPPIRQKLSSSHPSRSIGPLIGSVREFIAHYEKVENESDDGDHPRSEYTEGLHQLVQQLEGSAAHR